MLNVLTAFDTTASILIGRRDVDPPPLCYTVHFLYTWADHLIPGLIFFPGNYNT